MNDEQLADDSDVADAAMNAGTDERATASDARPVSLVWMPIRVGAATSIATTIVLLLATTMAITLAPNRDADRYFATIAAAGADASADASWLLPLLFGAVLAVLGILIGQSFSEVPPTDADVNRRRLAAACWVIAGIALTNFALSILSLADPEHRPTHTWAVSVATFLIVVASFWVGSLVFGQAEQQLRLLHKSIAGLDALRNAIPAANVSARPGRRMSLIAMGTILASLLVATAVVAILSACIGLPGSQGWFPTAGLGVVAALGGCAQACLIAQIRDGSAQTIRGVVGAVYSTAIAASPIAVIVAGLTHQVRPLILVVIVGFLIAYSIPIISVFLPRSVFRGWTLRGGVDAVRFRSLSRRKTALEASSARLLRLLETEQQRVPRHAR